MYLFCSSEKKGILGVGERKGPSANFFLLLPSQHTLVRKLRPVEPLITQFMRIKNWGKKKSSGPHGCNGELG